MVSFTNVLFSYIHVLRETFIVIIRKFSTCLISNIFQNNNIIEFPSSLEQGINPLSKDGFILFLPERYRGKWAVYYTSPQSFLIVGLTTLGTYYDWLVY